MRRGSIAESIFATYACVHTLTARILFVTYFAAYSQRQHAARRRVLPAQQA